MWHCSHGTVPTLSPYHNIFNCYIVLNFRMQWKDVDLRYALHLSSQAFSSGGRTEAVVSSTLFISPPQAFSGGGRLGALRRRRPQPAWLHLWDAKELGQKKLTPATRKRARLWWWSWGWAICCSFLFFYSKMICYSLTGVCIRQKRKGTRISPLIGQHVGLSVVQFFFACTKKTH